MFWPLFCEVGHLDLDDPWTQLPDGGYDRERIVHLQLPRLDTGSSRDPDRIGTTEQREAAAEALSRGVGAGEES